MARKHVTPADAGASIPDPIHGGYLPPSGRDVDFTGYWLGLGLRGDVIVGDPVDPVPGDPSPGPPVQAGDQILMRRGGIEVLLDINDLLFGVGLRQTIEPLTVASDGTLSALSHIPNDPSQFTLNIGGFVFHANGPSPAVSFSATTVTWNSANVGGAVLVPSDEPIATYTY